MDRVPFPQANDFEKIVCLTNINNELCLKDFEFMSAFLGGITERQVSYYLSAAMYLGIINRDKKFTGLGNHLRTLNKFAQIIELIHILLSDSIIGSAYITQKVLEMRMETEDIAELIKKYYPDYTEPIYRRRAQTVQSWLTWIDSYMLAI